MKTYDNRIKYIELLMKYDDILDYKNLIHKKDCKEFFEFPYSLSHFYFILFQNFPGHPAHTISRCCD